MKSLNKNNQKAVLELKQLKIEKIKWAIFKKRISQKKLTEATGVSYIQLSRILNGHIKSPHWSTINKLEKFLTL